MLNIIGRFIHLQIEEKEDWEGRKSKKETLIFPRYHQWNVVTKLINAAIEEGTGNKYLFSTVQAPVNPTQSHGQHTSYLPCMMRMVTSSFTRLLSLQTVRY